MSRGMRCRHAHRCCCLLVVPAAAPAAADPGFDVPDDATITVPGDGSGHGRGMSQYGAYGAARAPFSLAADEILDFYYPGTDAGQRRRCRQGVDPW